MTDPAVADLVELLAAAGRSEGYVLVFTAPDGQLLPSPTNEANAALVRARARHAAREAAR